MVLRSVWRHILIAASVALARPIHSGSEMCMRTKISGINFKIIAASKIETAVEALPCTVGSQE